MLFGIINGGPRLHLAKSGTSVLGCAAPRRLYTVPASKTPRLHSRVHSAVPSAKQLVKQLQLREQCLTLRGRGIRLVAPADIDEVMDMYIDAGQNERDPYWCRPWPSGIALAEQILRRTHLVAGRKVCDLGAGLGVTGIAAALAGASSVTLLDREPLALQCALLSAQASGVTAAQHVLGADPTEVAAYISASSLGRTQTPSPEPAPSPRLPQPPSGYTIPYQPLSPQTSNPAYHSIPSAISGESSNSSYPLSSPPPSSPHAPTPTITAQAFDWAAPDHPDRYDVILACDVLYEGTAVKPISRLVPRLLKPGGYLMLADPPTRTPHNRQKFIDELQKRVAVVTLEEESLQHCKLEDTSQEMVTGACIGDSIPVQFMIFRCSW